jgi:UDP-glucose:(heptosyl)LPS alpha-1,3-glucosyltransferase
MDHRGVTRTGRFDSFVNSLDRHLNQTSYDVVHAMLPVPRCDVYHPHAGLAAAAVAEGSRASTLFNPRRSRFAHVERELLDSDRPPFVLCLSDYVRRNVRAHYALDDARLPILFNAVDLARFDPSLDVPGLDWLVQRHGWMERPVGLIVAQDFARKGVGPAIEALGRLEDLGLIVVGRDDSRPYRYLAESVGDRVLFTGPTGNTRPYYRHADFFVLPTKHDPCSLVVLEALAMGLPVISTQFNGACEIMTDGVHGFVLDDPNDIDALADAMRKMIDSSVRARMSRACLELRPRLSYDHHLRALLDIYDRAQTASATRAKSPS